MKTVDGIYTSAQIFTNHVEDYALAQVKQICDHPVSKESKIRVMPDVHPGKVGPIGLTMTVQENVLPSIVGVDIGCGISLTKIRNKRIEYQKLDKIIREQVPSGMQIRKKIHRFNYEFPYEKLKCFRHINIEKAMLSLGTLGAGNHFIEIDQDKEQNSYVAIHSGSRYLGKAVAEYYLKEGQKYLKEQKMDVPYELTYLTGELAKDYLHDQELVTNYAKLNRAAMMDELVKGMKWKIEDEVSCTHNYVEISEDYAMLRKGAISAKSEEAVVIPINMREGIILGVGKGNKEWNFSAPHGSGRLMKRTEVSDRYTVADFKKEMKGIYCTCIGKETLDEAPFVYRNLEEIRKGITETVEVKQIIKPVYNFKAGSKERS